MQSASLRIDVTHHTPFNGSVEAAAWLFAPPDGAPINGDLLVCLHGATCDHRYFHAEFTHHTEYSFAEYFTSLGYHVLAIDHPGMGSSTRPEPERLLTRDVVAAADDHIVRAVIQGLASGRWFGYRPRSMPRVIGLAHSLGGMLGIVQQARHRTFERMAVLGWSNIGVRFEGEKARGMADAAAHEGYLPAPRALTRALFHLPDVPVDLIEEDDARAGLTPANLGRAAMTPGIVARRSGADRLSAAAPVRRGRYESRSARRGRVLPRMPRHHTGGVAGIGSYAQLRIDAARWMAPDRAMARV